MVIDFEAFQETRVVLWLLEDDVEHVTQQEVGSRQVETPEPSIGGPASRLSTIAEKPRDLTEDAMFIYDEPNWQASDLEPPEPVFYAQTM